MSTKSQAEAVPETRTTLTLNDRMKDYERTYRTNLPANSYAIVRLDGKAFHTFTRGFERPFDLDLMGAMDTAARTLCETITQGVVMSYNGKFDAYQRTYVLQDFTIDPLFLKANLEMVIPNRVLREMQSSAMSYIRLSTLSDAVVGIPSLPEQKKIAVLLSTMDAKIDKEAQKLEALKEQKKGYMQRMFV